VSEPARPQEDERRSSRNEVFPELEHRHYPVGHAPWRQSIILHTKK